jgi:hypothetical protein
MVALISLTSILSLSGCLITPTTEGNSKTPTVFVYPRQPVYNIPERADIENISGATMAKLSPDERAVVIKNFQILLAHEAALKALIVSHNKYAEKMNAESGIYGSSQKDTSTVVVPQGGIEFKKSE